MPFSNPLRSLGVTSALMLLVTLMTSCAPTRVHIRTNENEVKQVFVVAAEASDLDEAFEGGSSRLLGDFAQNLPESNHNHTSLAWGRRNDSSEAWSVMTEPRQDWLAYKIAPEAQEVTVTIKRSAFDDPNTCLGIIVLTDTPTSGQKYFGKLLLTKDIEPTGFALIASGPSLRVRLEDDGAPVVDRD